MSRRNPSPADVLVMLPWQVSATLGVVAFSPRTSVTHARATPVRTTSVLAVPPAVETGVLCPTCGASMVKRTAKRGANAGNTFWGCSNYPTCRAVIAV